MNLIYGSMARLFALAICCMPPSAEASLAKLYSDHNSWLKSLIYRRLGCREAAADLAHDTFLRLLSRPPQFSDVAQERGYLRTVADRLRIDLWRRRTIERAWLEELASRPETVVLSPEDHAVILETFCELDAMLQRLPEKAAKAFLLSQFDGLTYREIAAQLQVSERSVKSYMARAMLECLSIEANWREVSQ